ncbi:MAG: hypothetical protein ABGW82_02745 [Paracoccus sp. (in: a-proteobacteria)]
MAERRGFLSIFTRHRTLANLILMVMVVGGLYSAPRIRAQFFGTDPINPSRLPRQQTAIQYQRRLDNSRLVDRFEKIENARTD